MLHYYVALNFCGSLICGWAIFCVLQELILTIGKKWFFLLEINFCDFQEVAINWNYNICVFYLSSCNRSTCETTCSRKTR